MAKALANSSSGVVTYTISVNGKKIADTNQVLSIQVSKEVNKIASAKVRIADGGVATENKFASSETADFVPGKDIEIKIGYNSTEKTVFKGVIISHGLKINAGKRPYLLLDCRDHAVAMTTIRRTAIFQKKTDNQILSQVIGNYGKVGKEIGAASTQYPEIIQHNVTDWDFVLMRAEMNGFIVVNNDNKLIVKAPKLSGSPKIKVEYGVTMLEFNAQIDARTQFAKATCYAWDYSKQKIQNAKGNPVSADLGGDLKAKALADVFNKQGFEMVSTTNLASGVLDVWASAKLAKSALAYMQGYVKFLGDATVVPGDLIELAGLSKRFNGNAFVGGVEHNMSDGVWTTEVKIGASSRWYYEEVPNIESPTAAGIIPPMQGLTTGIVKKIDEDPDGNFRVQVALPTLRKDNMPVWARLATFYASAEAGAFFMPETDDEVLVAFLDNDPQCPVIVGAMHNKSSKKAPLAPEKENPKKAIVTKSKLKITFDDKDKILTIETPAKNMMTFDDKDGKVTIVDKNKNKVEMSSDGIVIDSPKDVKISGQNVKIEAKTAIEIKANTDFKVEGTNVTIKAKAKLGQEGAMAELKGSATTTIKGGMVMIN